MTSTDDRRPVIFEVNTSCGCLKGTRTSTYQIDRDEWNEMTRAERIDTLDSYAEAEAGSRFDFGWHIPDADDAAMTEEPTRG